jgi:hypothetical protein
MKIIKEYGEFFFPQYGLAPCPKCGEPTGLHIDISATGFSAGGRTIHKSDCKTQFCEHGIHFSKDCSLCDDAAIDEEY